MFYTSTRDKTVHVRSAEAITRGISADGGLFLPEEIPQITLSDIDELSKMGYKDRAKKILPLYLTDFTKEEISDCVDGAYADGKFSSEKIAPLYSFGDGVEILELWKGPTCAFKDMALQLLPHLLTTAAKKAAGGKKIVILVATSGDTGKAALEGFRDVPDTKIAVFYPNDGVSPMQKLQMVTQEGGNVAVFALNGNFDDAQNGVKAIFTDKNIADELLKHNMMFSSANSINWGRLVPQIVYYISAYCDMVADGKIKNGDEINIVVPTGNFGNILAAYYAKEMGIPVKKLVCASNANKVLTDFINTGVYDRRREFYVTASPSMDILISSNLERLLFILSDCDDKKVRKDMKELSENGVYDVGESVRKKISDLFVAGFCDDVGTKATIKKEFDEKKYLCDTHTAVAVNVYYAYREKTGDKTPTVIASTASPFKFCAAVLDALSPDLSDVSDEFKKTEKLSEITGLECPRQIASLHEKKIRFDKVVDRKDMADEILKALL
ncbi:MAG: threonine synthase [Clostridiales bacterium]|nr:threonine synthase [Clostridiales bacterium]